MKAKGYQLQVGIIEMKVFVQGWNDHDFCIIVIRYNCVYNYFIFYAKQILEQEEVAKVTPGSKQDPTVWLDRLAAIFR